MRVSRGVVRHRRHKKIRKLAKGYRGMRSSTFRKANEAVMKAGQHAYRGRREKKRTFRALWITRISAAAKEHNVNYSTLVKALKDQNIGLNRKVLSELAIHEPKAFEAVLKQAKVGA
ncbi:50S ribosomal protein L20 [Candidatus Peregrinibacteria bacterium CG10_big_fil_rev_8_21_14_0_10_49_24]|nr:MAG: 50S ribosomal protein L20 [Candidatus Peregrinibacteria bacterium CG11_big_fil_rev_8_21_14_0_20_49_14]PIR51583.1 MAG: 50S ribosomal protein L20 [Candidatus Peregrinibacteria bacterium CG10_big_fil_rev_8_21_14_0_10_49_24]PJA68055.1 MAG: 50S ribosomal protein L20 [Candidatus Peregrinibacteria bacterium CG_4_9_14_3_um_filter_49_12]